MFLAACPGFDLKYDDPINLTLPHSISNFPGSTEMLLIALVLVRTETPCQNLLFFSRFMSYALTVMSFPIPTITTF